VSAPWQAVTALAWAIVAPPLLLYAATRIRAAQLRLHQGLMIAAVIVEVSVVISFAFIDPTRPGRAELGALPIFKIHLVFAITALAGIAWQLLSRAIPSWRVWHRQSGPYVILVWCLALLTGIYNFVFLYVLSRPETTVG
jgi:hypothetical protein